MSVQSQCLVVPESFHYFLSSMHSYPSKSLEVLLGEGLKKDYTFLVVYRDSVSRGLSVFSIQGVLGLKTDQVQELVEKP